MFPALTSLTARKLCGGRTALADSPRIKRNRRRYPVYCGCARHTLFEPELIKQEREASFETRHCPTIIPRASPLDRGRGSHCD